MKIAILGGTGPEGSGLGLRWAQAGHEVIIGSRQAEKGELVAQELQARSPEAAPRISGADNLTALAGADLAVLSVPYAAQERTLAGLQDCAGRQAAADGRRAAGRKSGACLAAAQRTVSG